MRSISARLVVISATLDINKTSRLVRRGGARSNESRSKNLVKF